MEQRWQDTRRSHMVRMLLDKKKLERSELERRRGPCVAAQEAHHLKTLKLRQVLRQGPAIFRESVKMLFPEVSRVSKEKLSFILLYVLIKISEVMLIFFNAM